jgi:mRNA interferase MazF
MICWADIGPIRGSRPAKHRPVLVVQDDRYNHSGLATAVVAVLTSNTSRAQLPGNVFVPASASGLPKDSAVSVLGLVTVDKEELSETVGVLPEYLMREVDQGLRRVLGL